MQPRAMCAKNIVEIGTLYGISNIYLALGAKANGGKVITTEYLDHKAEAARKNLEEAGLIDYVEIRKGDAIETLRELSVDLDLVLLDGWPNLVFPVFKLIEPHFKTVTIVYVDDVGGFKPAIKDYIQMYGMPIMYTFILTFTQRENWN